MTPEQHLEKARRILKGLAKLDPADDTLALIDGTMIAGYHLGNAELHRHGVTDVSVHFNTPSKLEMPVAALPAAIKPAYDAFAALENLRSTYVRSPRTPDAEVGREAQRLMQAMARCCGIGDD
jgi:hypothetical protein